MVGGNITVINSVEEYDQLTDQVLNVLSSYSISTFNVHVESERLKRNINKGCAIINVHDGTLHYNTKKSENTNCTTTGEINTIICESTDISPEICPLPATAITSVSELLETSSVTSTGGYTDSSTNNIISQPNASEQSSTNLVVAICVPLVVVIILIVIIAFFLIRRKKKKRQMVHKGFSYGDGVLIPTHSDEITSPPETPMNAALFKGTEHTQHDMEAATSSPANPNNVAMALYAVPNKKKHKDEDSSEAYDSLTASDMPPDKATDNNGDVTYVNTDELQTGGEMYDCINAAELNSGKEKHNNENKTYENTTTEAYYANSTNMQSTTDTNTDEKPDGDIYSAANEEAHNNDFGNEYGKLDIDTSPQNDGMYSFVDTSINTSPEDSTYDRLQRNK
ncbi:uncharacterized protein [Antedon mediterranea]|uniref:uncharacterized protein n=1 Tax=Antedon mediterranea TaxID=105859 RepID=UPI003AF5BFB1